MLSHLARDRDVVTQDRQRTGCDYAGIGWPHEPIGSDVSASTRRCGPVSVRAVLTIVAIFAAVVLALSLAFPDVLRGASNNGTLASLIQLLMVAILVGSGLFGRSGDEKISFSDGVKFGAIWVGIGLFLIAAYSQRDGFSRLWSNITGEINPSSAQTAGDTVTLRKSDDGHFWAQVLVNGQSIRMMVDTGATDIALDIDDARSIGIDPGELTFNIPVSTANGPSLAAAVTLDGVVLGDIARTKVPATIMQARGGVSLLGMGFLGELSEVKAQGDILTLRD
jgi:aspartyl protease family protein